MYDAISAGRGSCVERRERGAAHGLARQYRLDARHPHLLLARVARKEVARQLVASRRPARHQREDERLLVDLRLAREVVGDGVVERGVGHAPYQVLDPPLEVDAALLALREGIYADILEEAAAREAAKAAREAADGKASRAQVDRGLSQVKAIFARSQAPGLTDSRRGSRRPSRAQM